LQYVILAMPILLHVGDATTTTNLHTSLVGILPATIVTVGYAITVGIWLSVQQPYKLAAVFFA